MAGLINSMGRFWSLQLVTWGPKSKQEMLGVYARRLDGSRGALPKAQRERQTINIWSLPGVYCLYRGDEVIYVGQASALGDRLLAHHSFDHLVGRWDSFSWVSPVEIEEVPVEIDPLPVEIEPAPSVLPVDESAEPFPPGDPGADRSGEVKLRARPIEGDPIGTLVPGPASLEDWLSEVESLTILFADPVENRQVPSLGNHVWEFDQVRSESAAVTSEEMLRALYEKLIVKG